MRLRSSLNISLCIVFLFFSYLSAEKTALDTQPKPESAPKAQNGQKSSTTESEAEAETEDPSAAEVPTRHDEITVTATRTPTDLRRIGQTALVITNQEIQAKGSRTVAHVLEGVPGFSVARAGSFGGATSVFVRGGESDFNLVMIDGVKVNQPGGTYDFADLATSNIERIEIVRGPSSVLYGANAASSTINIVTRKGEGLPSGLFRFEGGTYGTLGFQGDLSGGTERFSYSLGGQVEHSDGLYKLNSGYQNSVLSARTSFFLTPGSTITGLVRHTDSDLEVPTDFTGAIVDPNDFRASEETTYSIAFEKHMSSRYGTKVQFGYNRGDYRTLTVQDGIVDYFDSEFAAIHNRQQFDWQNNLLLNADNLLTAGIVFEKEETEVESLDRRSAGFYVQDQFSHNDRFFITAGIRYENNNRFKDFLTGTMSIGYLVNEKLKLRGSLGNGFRAPAFYESFGFPDFGIVGNPDLKPEKNTALDAGLDFIDSNGRSRISVTGFWNRFADLIEFTFLSEPGTPNYLNLERARSRGLELDGFYSLTETLRIGGQYTLTDTKVLDGGSIPGGNFAEGEQLLRRPRNMLGVHAAYSPGRYDLRVDFKFKGQRDDIQFFPDFSSARVVLPSYWKADVSVKIPLLTFSDTTGELALTIRGENIFNREYTEIAGFQSVGRSLLGGLQFGF